MENKIRRGDIYYIDKYPTIGSEQQAGRPAIIVSNEKNNQHSSTVEVVYLTTQPKADLPTHVTSVRRPVSPSPCANRSHPSASTGSAIRWAD